MSTQIQFSSDQSLSGETYSDYEDQAPPGFTEASSGVPTTIIQPFTPNKTPSGHYVCPYSTTREFSRWCDAKGGHSYKFKPVENLTSRRHTNYISELQKHVLSNEPVRLTSAKMLREKIRSNQWGIYGKGNRPPPTVLYTTQMTPNTAQATQKLLLD